MGDGKNNARRLHEAVKSKSKLTKRFSCKPLIMRGRIEGYFMKTYYEESDLVSFGLYLLSDKRNDSILKNNNNDADFTKVIYDADLANWKHKISQENLSTAEPSDLA